MIEYFKLFPVASSTFAATLLMSIYAFAKSDIYEKWMLHPYTVARGGRVYSVITSGFIHADWGHLLFNMITFYYFAIPLEGIIGSWKFAIIYFLGMVISDLPSIKKHKNDFSYRSLGASGAISAALFSYILFEPLQKVFIFFIPVGIPAVVFGVLYLIYCALASKYSKDHINHDAHLYGALAGLLLTVILVPGIISYFISQLHFSLIKSNQALFWRANKVPHNRVATSKNQGF